MVARVGLFLLRRQVASIYNRTIAQSVRGISSGTESHLPRIAQPSLWHSIIPKSLRNRDRSQISTEKKPPNPATYFIWIYLLIGSQAIRIIGTQNEHTTFMRKAELKVAKLREVIQKLQKGEPVDVEKELGTGDEAQELEWEDALKEIENEDRAWRSNKRKREEAKAKMEAEEQEASPINESQDMTQDVEQSIDTQTQTLPRIPPGFY